MPHPDVLLPSQLSSPVLLCPPQKCKSDHLCVAEGLLCPKACCDIITFGVLFSLYPKLIPALKIFFFGGEE